MSDMSLSTTFAANENLLAKARRHRPMTADFLRRLDEFRLVKAAPPAADLLKGTRDE